MVSGNRGVIASVQAVFTGSREKEGDHACIDCNHGSQSKFAFCIADPALTKCKRLDSRLVFSKPQDRLFAGQIDRMDRFSLRYRARKFQSEQYRMPWSGLRHGMRYCSLWNLRAR